MFKVTDSEITNRLKNPTIDPAFSEYVKSIERDKKKGPN